MKRGFLILLAVAILLSAGAAWVFLPPPDAERAEALLQRAFAREEYGFILRAAVAADGAETPYFELTGSKSGDSSAVRGTVLGEEVELSFHDGVLTQILPDGSTANRELDPGELGALCAELLPESAFAHQGLEVTERRRDIRGLTLTLRPLSCSGWVDDCFCDPVYTVDCDLLCRRVRTLTLTATEKANGKAALTLTVEFL